MLSTRRFVPRTSFTEVAGTTTKEGLEWPTTISLTLNLVVANVHFTSLVRIYDQTKTYKPDQKNS